MNTHPRTFIPRKPQPTDNNSHKNLDQRFQALRSNQKSYRANPKFRTKTLSRNRTYLINTQDMSEEDLELLQNLDIHDYEKNEEFPSDMDEFPGEENEEP